MPKSILYKFFGFKHLITAIPSINHAASSVGIKCNASNSLIRAGDTGGREEGGWAEVSKRKILKGYHQGQNVTILAILKRLEFKKISCRPTMVADSIFQSSKSISRALLMI